MLTVNNVSYAYEKFMLRDVSFNLDDKVVLAILGANGSGKSTLIKCLMQNLEYEGSIKFNNSLDFIEQVFYTPDTFPFDEFTWNQVSLLYELNYPGFDKTMFSKTLVDFRIKSDSLLKKLSSGDKQKFMMALSIATSANLFILDEPSDSIDPFTRQFIVSMLLDHIIDTAQNTIIATHNIEPYENIVDSVVILSKGRVLISDTKENLMTNGVAYLVELGISDDDINVFKYESTLPVFMKILQGGGY